MLSSKVFFVKCSRRLCDLCIFLMFKCMEQNEPNQLWWKTVLIRFWFLCVRFLFVRIVDDFGMTKCYNNLYTWTFLDVKHSSQSREIYLNGNGKCRRAFRQSHLRRSFQFDSPLGLHCKYFSRAIRDAAFLPVRR